MCAVERDRLADDAHDGARSRRGPLPGLHAAHRVTRREVDARPAGDVRLCVAGAGVGGVRVLVDLDRHDGGRDDGRHAQARHVARGACAGAAQRQVEPVPQPVALVAHDAARLLRHTDGAVDGDGARGAQRHHVAEGQLVRAERVEADAALVAHARQTHALAKVLNERQEVDGPVTRAAFEDNAAQVDVELGASVAAARADGVCVDEGRDALRLVGLVVVARQLVSADHLAVDCARYLPVSQQVVSRDDDRGLCRVRRGERGECHVLTAERVLLHDACAEQGQHVRDVLFRGLRRVDARVVVGQHLGHRERLERAGQHVRRREARTDRQVVESRLGSCAHRRDEQDDGRARRRLLIEARHRPHLDGRATVDHEGVTRRTPLVDRQ